MVAKGRFFSNISWSSAQNGALVDAKSVCAAISERAEQVLREALQSKI
jgi:hypothetical protein